MTNQVKKTIVLMDADAQLTGELNRLFMLSPDFELKVSPSGMDGLGLVQQNQAAFAVVAIPLPDIDAVQLLPQLAASAPQTRKIVTLEHENPMLSSQMMMLGAHYVLVKPYTAEKLMEIIVSLENQTGPVLQTGGFAFPPQGVGPAPAAAPPASAYSREAMLVAMQTLAAQQGHSGAYPAAPPMAMPQPYGYPPQAAPAQYPPPQGFPPPQNPYGAPMGGGFPPPQNPYGAPPTGAYPQPDPATIVPFPNTPAPGGASQAMGGVRTIKQTVVAVNCPKGGVGKTTISKELALAYATVRVGGQPLKVCLVDVDLEFGDVTTMLNLQPYPNVSHWTADIQAKLKQNPNLKPSDIKYTKEQVDKYLITHPSGLKVLAAPSNQADSIDIGGLEMEVVVNSLKDADFDVIVLDTGNNTRDFSIVALDKANVILMVLTLDVPAINDTRMLLQTLRTIQFPTSKIKLVINRHNKANSDINVADVLEVLKCDLMGVVPEYPRIQQLNNSGNAAVLAKETPFSASIRKLANEVVPVFNRPARGPAPRPPQGGPVGQPPRSSGGGLFGKLFRK